VSRRRNGARQPEEDVGGAKVNAKQRTVRDRRIGLQPRSLARQQPALLRATEVDHCSLAKHHSAYAWRKSRLYRFCLFGCICWVPQPEIVLHTPLQDSELCLTAGPSVRWRWRDAFFFRVIIEDAPQARKARTKFNAVRARTCFQLTDEHGFPSTCLDVLAKVGSSVLQLWPFAPSSTLRRMNVTIHWHCPRRDAPNHILFWPALVGIDMRLTFSHNKLPSSARSDKKTKKICS
jgi:hypothetical protein